MSSKRCVPDDPAWTHYLEYRYKHYAHRIYGDDLAGRLMRRSHQWLERVAAIREKKSIILELGSGQSGHRAFVSHPHDQYINSDIEFLTPRAEEDRDYSGSLDWQLMQSATELALRNASIDRIVSLHAFEHIPNPHRIFEESLRVLRLGGLFTALIPADPGVLWRLGRHLGPRQDAVQAGLAYDYIMAREHINSAHNLIALFKHYFPRGRLFYWPSGIPVVDVNLFIGMIGMRD